MTAVGVTGLGVLAPTGVGKHDYWASTRIGKSGIGPITTFDTTRYPNHLAGEIRDFAPEQLLPGRLKPQTDRVTRLSLVAADWALQDADLDLSTLDPFTIGVSTASSAGGFGFAERELQALWSKGGQYVSAYQSFAWFYAVNTGQISIRNGLKGPSGVVVSDAAGGLDAIAQARRQIRKGTTTALTGAVDSTLCAWGLVGIQSSGLLSTCGDPDRAYLPFDRDASGHVPGEGGSMFVLESVDSARERGREVYGVISGYGATFDPGDGPPRKDGLRRAISNALTDADVAADDIDVIFADAAGIPELDRAEADAIIDIFGKRRVPVTAPKAAYGRLCAGGGPLDVATALLAIGDSTIPPTINVEPDHTYGLDLVCQPRAARLHNALVIARGYRGFNSAVVLTAPR
ncbi:ketosynthase chain-length factor [Rhodococcus erythropolis]|uniref:ketosynthase chain-length factor n=1 Tax=Rhodococcus erythropolis TaxID=1833 RepID=UPI00366D1685